MKKSDYPKNSKGGGASVGGKGSSARSIAGGYDPKKAGDNSAPKRKGMMKHVSKHDVQPSTEYSRCGKKLTNGATDVSESRDHGSIT